MNIQFEKITDKELINRVIVNEPGAIDFLFRNKCTGILSCISNRIFDGLVSVAELTNDWKIEIEKQNWQKLRHFKYESTLYSWLCIVATRYFLQKKHSLEIIETEIIPVQPKILISFVIDGGIQKYDRVQIINTLLKLHNPQERLVLLWYILGGMTISEIARKLDMAPDTVKSIKELAIEQLFHRFKEIKHV